MVKMLNRQYDLPTLPHPSPVEGEGNHLLGDGVSKFSFQLYPFAGILWRRGAGGALLLFAPFECSQEIELKIVWLNVLIGGKGLFSQIQRLDEVGSNDNDQLRLLLLEAGAPEESPEDRNVP